MDILSSEAVSLNPILPPPRETPYRNAYESYGSWKHHGKRIGKRARTVAALLPEAMSRCNADHIVVCGTSGTWMAAAVLMLLPDLRVIELHKDDTRRHGPRREGTLDADMHRGLIIDDCVCSGDTVRGMIASSPARIVGVLLHDGAEQGFALCASLAGNRFNIPVWEIV